ncbi:hypothetical protein HAX54_017583 [Datura stramonium]|uniref:TF-B3 domain-containing protein n=1 Tax=Datura stramonium TaxID=4076 RepID=A0ABS8S429_DATST|nr:hypothetical protein [Datura stramonium]
MVEEEEEIEDKEPEVVEEEEDNEDIEKASRSKYRYVKEEEEDDKNERASTFKKKEPQSKVNFLDSAGCKRSTASKVREHHDYFGADIFKSGCATKPKNPYFAAKMQAYKGYEVLVPVDVVRDYKLELPSSMIIRDSAGREFETKLKIWKDGRIWLVGGWRSLCRWNLIEKNDKCICEFVREKCNKGLYLQVQVFHEGASSHPNKKNKK